MPSAVIQQAEDHNDSIPTHPLNVKPLGNKFLATGPDARANAGSWALLPDEILMNIFEQFDQSVLLRIGTACKLLYAFARADELWKALFLKLQPSEEKCLSWRGSWRSTVLGLTKDVETRISCDNVYSDVLHRPFACSNIHLSTYADNIPKANQIRRFKNLTYDKYADSWTETPFILTECIQEWPVYSKWSIPTLLEQYADVDFRAEAVDWKFSRYCDYMNNTRDESPLYLFDRKFAEKMDLKVGHDEGAAYWKPDCFGPDMFELLGKERPAHRWMIIGPQRSGSTFHKDPNGTSAWNAVIQGSKYWIMFPPSADVPGVYVSKDSSEVTSPLSIAEWLLTFHTEARQTPGCIEGICEAGEILHVPSGWWHLVVNLENGIALTQNFVPKSPSLKLLSEAIGFLRDKADQVSGFEDSVENPYQLFEDRLKQSNPDMLDRALKILDKANGKKRKWDDVLATDDVSQEGAGGFSFGFGGGDLEDDEIP